MYGNKIGYYKCKAADYKEKSNFMISLIFITRLIVILNKSLLYKIHFTLWIIIMSIIRVVLY